MHSIEIRFVIGPSDVLFGDVGVCTFQPRNFTGQGSEGVKKIKNNNNKTKNKSSYLRSFDSFLPQILAKLISLWVHNMWCCQWSDDGAEHVCPSVMTYRAILYMSRVGVEIKIHTHARTHACTHKEKQEKTKTLWYMVERPTVLSPC